MAKSAYIKFVTGSTVKQLTLEEVKNMLADYKQQLELTGQQLDWNYAEAAFPYMIATKAGEESRWFYLKGTSPLYRHILFAVGMNVVDEQEHHFVHVVVPEDATHGDHGKAVEYVKWMAKKLKAELTLFNGRTMYYNPRK